MGFKNGKCEYCHHPHESSVLRFDIPCCCEKTQNEWIHDNLKITKDGDSFCALWGIDLQKGIAVFGATEEEAILNLISIFFDLDSYFNKRAKSAKMAVGHE